MLKTLLLIGFVVSLVGCQQMGSDKTVKIATENDSVSYSYGVAIAENLKKEKGLNPDMVAAAVKEALTEKAQMDATQCGEIIVKSLSKTQLAYLKENATKEGVVTTASGLQYKVIEEGSGEFPTATSEVTVHYIGKLIDGSTFDSSVDRGEPITFPLNRVIAGWTEGLMLMKTGGKMTLYIPYQLGYGDKGHPPVIPAFATLIFDVELISFK